MAHSLICCPPQFSPHNFYYKAAFQCFYMHLILTDWTKKLNGEDGNLFQTPKMYLKQTLLLSDFVWNDATPLALSIPGPSVAQIWVWFETLPINYLCLPTIYPIKMCCLKYEILILKYNEVFSSKADMSTTDIFSCKCKWEMFGYLLKGCILSHMHTVSVHVMDVWYLFSRWI